MICVGLGSQIGKSNVRNDFNLCLETIERDRGNYRGDLILAYNIFHGRLDFPHAEFFEAPAERNLRGHDFKMRHRNFRLLRR